MDATLVALISAAVVAVSTVIAALISTIGHMRALRESATKERLRDEVDSLRSENRSLRKAFAHSLRQTAAFHVLEDIYFKKYQPARGDKFKSEFRELAKERCGVYPRFNSKQCLAWADEIESAVAPLPSFENVAEEVE